MEIRSLDEFNFNKPNILLTRSYYVGADGTQHPGAAVGTIYTPEAFFAQYTLQVLTMDSIVIDFAQEAEHYPKSFTYLTRLGQVASSYGEQGQGINPITIIEVLDDFFDFIEPEIADRFTAPEWKSLKDAIQVAIEEQEISLFSINSDKTLNVA